MQTVEFTLGAQLGCLTTNIASARTARAKRRPFHSLKFAPLPNPAVLAASRRCAFGTRTILDKSNRFQGQEWTVVRAGFRRCAKRSPTGFRSRLGRAPSLVAALVSRAISRKTIRLQAPKPGRNERCPCGSGEKYKKCWRRLTSKSSPRSLKLGYWAQGSVTPQAPSL